MSFYTYDFKKLPPSSGGHHPKGVGVTVLGWGSRGGHPCMQQAIVVFLVVAAMLKLKA